MRPARIFPMALFGALLAACQSGPSATEAPSPETRRESDEAGEELRLSPEAAERAGIRVAKVERRALGGRASIPGEIQFDPTSTAHVGPLVSGRVTRVAVALGERVSRGQLLAVIASGDVSATRARLDQARARLAAAEATLKRQQQLSSEGIGAQRTLIQAEAEVGELRAEVEGLRRQLSVLGSGRAGDLSLTSPIDGVVVDVDATLGETISPESTAFIVTDPTKVWVRGDVPELEIEHIHPGAPAVVRLHAFPDLAMPGSLIYVAPALDERTRALPIRVSLDVPDPRLRSGLFASIELVDDHGEGRSLTVPLDAVITIDAQTFVFVPGEEPHTFRPALVSLGRRAGGFHEVRAGLEEGQEIVVSGAFTLKSVLRKSEIADGHGH